MNIPRFALSRRTVVWVLVAILTAWGAFNYSTISRREDPEIKISIALVITIYPGASAEKVERLVTQKLEDEISSLGVLEEISSTTRENLSVIFVEVQYKSDVDMAWQKLRNRIEEVRPELPDGIIGPDVVDDFGDVTALIYSLSSTTASPAELESWADELELTLRSVEAVGTIKKLGTQKEVIYVEGPLDSFSTYAFSPLVAARILDAQNTNIPSGYVRTPDRNLRLESSGSFHTLRDLEEAILDVSTTSGHPLRVRDVFSVRRAFQEPPLDMMFTNGKPSVALDVRMKPGHNVVRMGEEVTSVVEAFRARLPPSISLDLVHDQPREVDDFIEAFLANLWEGLAIVIVVMFLVMGLRTTAIVAVSLPLSIVFTFALMPSFGVAMETVSIAAFIIALGMLVDNAIIVADNIYRHMEAGADRRTAAVEGTQEIIVPAVSGTLATVLAFLPLLLMQNEAGAYVRALPIVVSISLIGSLLLAVTVTPILADGLLKLRGRDLKAQGKTRPSWFRRAYGAFMRGGMKLRYLVILASLAALFGAGALMQVVGFSYFPEADRDQFTVDIWLPEGSAIAETERITREAEAIVAAQPEVTSYVSYVGVGGPRFFISVKPEFNTSNYARIMANTRDKNETRALVERLNERFPREIAGAQVSAANILMGIPVEAPIVLRITGPDVVTMRGLSQQVQQILRDTPGTTFVRDNLGDEVTSLDVVIDRDRAVTAGVTNTEAAVALLTAYEGFQFTSFREGKDAVPVYFRLREDQRDLGDALHTLSVPSQATGAKVPLSAFASVEPRWDAGLVKHRNGRRYVAVLANVHGRLADEVLREALPKIRAIELPPGYNLDVAGEQAEREKSFTELLMIFGLIIGLLVLMLTIQFNSIKRALVVLASVPLAFIGAVLGLYFSGYSFSFMVFLGVISLAGMVIKNAVVWVEFVDHEVRKGLDFPSAIVEAGLVRFRPILLTAATTVGGLLPLALFGGVLWESMAWAMIAGLALATVLTLVVIPIIYYTAFRRAYAKAAQ